MAYPASIPTKPAYKQRWDGWADSIDAAVRELIVDVPPMKTQVTQAATRVSQAETAITALQNSSASTASTAGTALSTAQAAATSAAASFSVSLQQPPVGAFHTSAVTGAAAAMAGTVMTTADSAEAMTLRRPGFMTRLP